MTVAGSHQAETEMAGKVYQREIPNGRFVRQYRRSATRRRTRSVLQIPTPVPLGRLAKAFDDFNWIYEIKHDGFRALAVIEHAQCRFFSEEEAQAPMRLLWPLR